MIIIFFIVAKLVLYTFWCWYGIRLLAPARRNAVPIALGLASLRLVVGFVLGLAWLYSIGSVAPSDEYSRLGFDPLTFGIGFLLFRFLQWSGISLLITWGTQRFSLWGAGIADWLWRLGGVGLSFLGDVAAIVLYVGVFGVIC